MTLRVLTVRPRGSFDPAQAVDAVHLDHDERARRRAVLTTRCGRRILVDLPRAYLLEPGDALELQDGSLVTVEAAEEALLEVRADPQTLLRIAWHLGNRHAPVQVLPGRLRLRTDPVLAELARRLGGEVVALRAPFEPEKGAHAHAHRH